MTFLKKIINKLDSWFSMDIDAMPPEGRIDHLPTGLWSFMWFFLRQVKGTLILITVAEMIMGLTISFMFWYVGHLVESGEYTTALLIGGAALLIAKMKGEALLDGLYQLKYTPHFGNLVRRQLFNYTSRQSLSFFQNDFAGRISNKIMQSAPAMRDAVKSTIGAVWFAMTFTASNIVLMANQNIWLALPMIAWVAAYIVTLVCIVPKVKDRATKHSEDMSQLTGQVVDSLTNALPAKYFAREAYEDERVTAMLQKHSDSFRKITGTIYGMQMILSVLNTLLILATALIGLKLLEQDQTMGLTALAMGLPMTFQAMFQSNWIMFEVSGIFENLGAVQEAIDTLAKEHGIKDKEDAPDLDVESGRAEIKYSNIGFSYGSAAAPQGGRVLEKFSLHIPAGQKVGVVGRSGAGKTTLTGLLVRAYDVQDGEILINDQNISAVTQGSLRRAITVVTQDSYLFHRSVSENIRYGKPDASIEEVIAAAKKAHAHDFIVSLQDNKGREGYDAHVGERGVKLSGGQKQRISIARAILKDAPILILDEATSALDSESEQAIQQALEGIMEKKTVIAVAHRLSTLRQMDRIIVMDAGRIIEDGTHRDLITMGGHYADLWAMQSGGFLKEEATERKAAE